MSTQPRHDWIDARSARSAYKTRTRSVFQRLDLEIALREAEVQHDHAEACRSFAAAMARDGFSAAIAERAMARIERASSLLQELACVRVMLSRAGHELAHEHEPSDFEPTLALRLRPSERTLAAERMEAGAATVAELAAEHGRRLEADADAEPSAEGDDEPGLDWAALSLLRG